MTVIWILFQVPQISEEERITSNFEYTNASTAYQNDVVGLPKAEKHIKELYIKST